MAKKDSFSEDYFLSKGFTRNASGGFDPPKFVHKVDLSQPTIQKQKVIETNDFNHKPVTEWFIANYNVPSKKNSRQNFVRNGKQISIPSKNHAEYVKMTKMQYATFGKEFRRTVETLGLKYPLRVEFTFIRDSKRRSDFTNCCQTVEDLMVDNNWLPDDDSLHLLPSFQPMEYDKNKPGVKIKLLTNV